MAYWISLNLKDNSIWRCLNAWVHRLSSSKLMRNSVTSNHLIYLLVSLPRLLTAVAWVWNNDAILLVSGAPKTSQKGNGDLGLKQTLDWELRREMCCSGVEYHNLSWTRSVLLFCSMVSSSSKHQRFLVWEFSVINTKKSSPRSTLMYVLESSALAAERATVYPFSATYLSWALSNSLPSPSLSFLILRYEIIILIFRVAIIK